MQKRIIESATPLEKRIGFSRAVRIGDINRVFWTPNADGSVRQRWEQSKDGGKTWKTVFEGLYTRRE